MYVYIILWYVIIPVLLVFLVSMFFWHGASLHLHTFYGNVFYTCFTSF